MNAHRRGWLALPLAMAATVSSGCLPRGEPPAGKQLIADHDAFLGAMVPPNGDGLLRILFMRPNPDPGGADLYEVSVDQSGEPSPERLLISDIEAELDLGCTWKIAPCSFDAKGRVMVYPNNPPPPPPGEYVKPLSVDPITGEVTDIDLSAGYRSGSGQRSFMLGPYATPQTGTLTEADGSTTSVELRTSQEGVSSPAFYEFIGEDFYYLDTQNRLIDLPPSKVPQQLATGVIAVAVASTPDGPLMMLTRPTADPELFQFSLRDPISGAETALPFQQRGNVQFSDDFSWLVYEVRGLDPTTNTYGSTFTLFDRSTGATQLLDVPAASVAWRPHRNQLWAWTYDNAEQEVISIVTPGSPTVTVTGTRFEGFSDSGTYWFSTVTSPNKSEQALDVGVADDPMGPRFHCNPPETFLIDRAELPDGRVLGSFYGKDVQRADVITVDPRTGERHVLAEAGRIAALGQTRFMGMFRFQEGRGDLTAVNLETGRSTVLAPEFTVTAFAEPQGQDLLAPGARIIYQFQARSASPYDGIWLVNAP